MGVGANLHGERGHRLGGREARGLAGAEVEARSVQPALDRAALDLSLAQSHGRVGADVLDGEDLLAVAGDRELLVGDGDTERLTVAEVVEGAGAFEAHDASPRRVAVAPASFTEGTERG